MSSRWDERGTGSDGRPRTRSGAALSRRRGIYRNHNIANRRPIFVENHTDNPRRQKWIPLDTRSVVTVTARSVTGAGQPDSAPRRTPNEDAHGRSSPGLWPHGPSAHRRDDCPTVPAIQHPAILDPLSRARLRLRVLAKLQAWSSLAPPRSTLRAFVTIFVRYAVHHGLIAGRYALCRVGLLFPTCVRGCAAQSPLIFKPGN